MPEMTKTEMYGLAQDAQSLVPAVGGFNQLGANILNDHVRRVYKIWITGLGLGPSIVNIWQGDAVVPNRVQLMSIVVADGATHEFGYDIDEPLLICRPTTSTIAVAVQNNQIYVAQAGAVPDAFRVTMSYYDTKG